jgi:hypothetical protein
MYYNPSKTTATVRDLDSLNNKVDGALADVVPADRTDWADQWTKYGFYTLYNTTTDDSGDTTTVTAATMTKIDDDESVGNEFAAYGIYAGTVTRNVTVANAGGYLMVDKTGNGTSAADVRLTVADVPVFAITERGNVTTATELSLNEVKAGDKLIYVTKSATSSDVAYIVDTSATISGNGAPAWLATLQADIVTDQNYVAAASAPVVKFYGVEDDATTATAVTTKDQDTAQYSIKVSYTTAKSNKTNQLTVTGGTYVLTDDNNGNAVVKASDLTPNQTTEQDYTLTVIGDDGNVYSYALVQVEEQNVTTLSPATISMPDGSTTPYQRIATFLNSITTVDPEATVKFAVRLSGETEYYIVTDGTVPSEINQASTDDIESLIALVTAEDGTKAVVDADVGTYYTVTLPAGVKAYYDAAHTQEAFGVPNNTTPTSTDVTFESNDTVYLETSGHATLTSDQGTTGTDTYNSTTKKTSNTVTGISANATITLASTDTTVTLTNVTGAGAVTVNKVTVNGKTVTPTTSGANTVVDAVVGDTVVFTVTAPTNYTATFTTPTSSSNDGQVYTVTQTVAAGGHTITVATVNSNPTITYGAEITTQSGNDRKLIVTHYADGVAANTTSNVAFTYTVYTAAGVAVVGGSGSSNITQGTSDCTINLGSVITTAGTYYATVVIDGHTINTVSIAIA